MSVMKNIVRLSTFDKPVSLIPFWHECRVIDCNEQFSRLTCCGSTSEGAVC